MSGVSYTVQPRLHDRRRHIWPAPVTVSNKRKVIHRTEREEKKNQLVRIHGKVYRHISGLQKNSKRYLSRLRGSTIVQNVVDNIEMAIEVGNSG